jgi:hypothetical protein
VRACIVSRYHARNRQPGPAVVLQLPQTCPCPNCSASGNHWLRQISREAHVNYFRCCTCGHVWVFPKRGVPGEPLDVTAPKRR